MFLTLSLGLLVLVHGGWSASPPPQVPQTLPLLLKPSCNDSQVLSVAGLALEKINEDRKEGYILSLNRVADVREHHQAGSGSMYYLTLDVLETTCHLVSKKHWKDCKIRQLHYSVYGQCKAIFYVNLPRRILHLPAYNCTIRPVSRIQIFRVCSICSALIPKNISDTWIFQTVSEFLEKINEEIGVGKKFHLFTVTRFRIQWSLGPTYLMEFLVTESPCNKSLPDQCLQPPADAQPVGICKATLRANLIKKYIPGMCEFFESQPTSAPESHPPEHQVPQQLASTAAPTLDGPKGSVQMLPDPPVGKIEDGQEKKPIVTFPAHVSLTTEPLGEILHLPSHFLMEKEELPIVLPFPEGSRSNECPGPAEHPNPLILPP